MEDERYFKIYGKTGMTRIESRVLEEMIQQAVAAGRRHLDIEAYGQHGIGGRLWKAGNEPIRINILGHSGQRAGAMGFHNTHIEIHGPASDDIGWLNAGAHIVVHGQATNGVGNAMAQGKIAIAGNIGARGMTMTKHNPRFAPPELWVLGAVGDYFGEFMAGGTAVVCGHEPQNPDNVLGYRPCVGMVGGRVFFRGPHGGYSHNDAILVPISDDDWRWLIENLNPFLASIHRTDLSETLSERNQWQLLRARTSAEKVTTRQRPMASFRKDVWEKELGKGGLIGDLTDLDRSPIPMITTGFLRRFVPVWENRKYLAPCEASCPTGIPVHDRWRLIRDGRMDEAVDLALAYTPFPATVCGYLCPNLCMQSCTRKTGAMPAVDVTQLGKASLNAGVPELPPSTGKRIAVIGGGPAGISVAWQLRRQGHEAEVYDMSGTLGGKISSMIPRSRISKSVIDAELERIKKVIPHMHLSRQLDRDDMERLREDYDVVVIAAGAQKPRMLPIPGNQRLTAASDFLAASGKDAIRPGKRVVIIGAGNVGCDVATEASRLGAEDILLLDVQEPLSFGKEREHAEAAGARFRWPVFTSEITGQGVKLNTGEVIPADTVVISIGDVPDLDFLPESVETERGFIKVDGQFRTTDPKFFAIGDIVKPGLLTDAIGAGRKAATAIHAGLQGGRLVSDSCEIIDTNRVSLEYFDPRITEFKDLDHCGSQCSSCGACRDCGICVAICPQGAISRTDLESGNYEYRVDENRCIGCGFCAGACPCGVWDLKENDPME